MNAAMQVTMAAPVLEFSAVSKRFGGLEALSGIDLRVMPGEICSVIGPNGAGKTTLFNLASCLLKPTTGRVTFKGEDITDLPAHNLAKRGLARTFQNLAVFKHETVIDNILTGMHSRLNTGIFGAAMFWGATRNAEISARETAEEIVEFLEIEAIRDLPVGTLSYGLQKRVDASGRNQPGQWGDQGASRDRGSRFGVTILTGLQRVFECSLHLLRRLQRHPAVRHQGRAIDGCQARQDQHSRAAFWRLKACQI